MCAFATSMEVGLNSTSGRVGSEGDGERKKGVRGSGSGGDVIWRLEVKDKSARQIMGV